MNTPPFSDAANSPTHNALAAHIDSDDVRHLYSSSWRALDAQPPPTIREILAAYRTKGDGDREMLLAMLQAKSAEDQRLASQAALRRTMLEITQAAEPEPLPSTPPSHISPPSYAHGPPISAQGVSPRIAHSSASHPASSSSSAAQLVYAAPREAVYHKMERSPELDVDGRPIGSRAHRRHSSSNAQHAPEAPHPPSRYSSQSQITQTSRAYPPHYQDQDADRRKRMRRSPSPPPPVATISQSSRGRTAVAAAAGTTSKPASSGAGTLKLHDSPPPPPPPTRSHGAFTGAPNTASQPPVSNSNSSSYPHAKSQLSHSSRTLVDNAGGRSSVPMASTSSSSYASRRAKRDYDELDDAGVEMETGVRGLSSQTGSITATYSAVRGQLARSLSPLEEEEEMAVNAQPNGPPTAATGGGANASTSGNVRAPGRAIANAKDGDQCVPERSVTVAGNANNANNTSSPPHSAHSTPPTRARKAQTTADRERWDAVLNGKRERVTEPEAHVAATEVEPAR